MELKNINHIQEEYEGQSAAGKFDELKSKHDLLVSKEHDRLEKQAERIRQKAADRLNTEAG